MKKLLAVLLCFGLVTGMTLGIVGCQDKKPAVPTKDKDKDKEKDKDAKEKDAKEKDAKEKDAKEKDAKEKK